MHNTCYTNSLWNLNRDTFFQIKYDAQSDLEKVDEQISKLEKDELAEENRQFERSRL